MTHETEKPRFVRCSGELPLEAAEIMEGLLILEGVEGAQTITPEFLPPDEAPLPEGFARMVFFVPAEETTESVGLFSVRDQWNAFLQRNGLDVERCRLNVTPLESEDWATAWRRYFHPIKIGHALWVSPTWEKATPGPGECTVELDPGMAFGTGGHETTSLVLAQIDAYCADNPHSSMLDVGTGSGILSLAAAKLGIPRIVAIDNDPEAVAIAIENRTLNRIDEEQLAISATPLTDIDGQFELVCANIISSVLIAMREDLKAKTKKNGKIVLAGLLNHERDDVALSFNEIGLNLVEEASKGEWTLLAFEKK